MKFYEPRFHEDCRRWGSFDTIPGLPGEILITHVNKDIIMGMHLHKKQQDCLAVIKGKIMIRLIKHRTNQEEKFVLSEHTHKTLIIPPNTWHGYRALEDSILIYYIDHKYDPKGSDEFRKKTQK